MPTNTPIQATQDDAVEYIGYSTTANSRALRAFSIRSGQQLCHTTTDNTPYQCSLSPSGKHLAVATSRVNHIRTAFKSTQLTDHPGHWHIQPHDI